MEGFGMTFTRPTLTQLMDRTRADLAARLPEADLNQPHSNLAVLARVLAGAVHGLYGHLDWLSRQVIADTAEAEYLTRHALLWGISRRAASAASGQLQVTGNPGTGVPAGTVWVAASGARYRQTLEVLLVESTAVVSVVALESGARASLAEGQTLQVELPVAGLESTATVLASGLISGADSEADEVLRARLLSRLQQAPQGGAKQDYAAWALECAGVTRAWVYPHWLGVGHVGGVFVRDNDSSPIPDAGEVATVAAYIAERAPVTATPVVFAPTPKPLNVTLRVTPDLASVRQSVEANLAALVRARAEPGGTLWRSLIDEAISLAPGEAHHDLVSPATDVTVRPEEMLVMGSVT